MNARHLATGIAVAAAFAAIGYGSYRLGMERGKELRPAPEASHTAKSPAGTERKILYWHDPMVPGQRFDKPGKSPYMDMQLVPVYADEAAQGPGVSVSPAMAQNLGMRTALVRKGSASTSVEAVGNVAYNERATVVVQSRAAGFVEKLFVRATLDPVAKGQPLVTIFVPEWAGAIGEYLALRKTNVDAAIVTAARERLSLLSITDDIVARSERDGIAQSRFTLIAPISGVVTELGVREGVMVQPGMALFRIVDLGTVWVEASIPESQAAQARVGASAQARTDAYPGRTFSGKLSAILPQIDAATRTLRARLEVSNPGAVLKPGMFVSVTLGSAAVDGVLLVPQEAVIATGKRNVVIVAADGNRYVPVEVTLGRHSGADVEVRSGLTEGQRVVTSGQFLIDSEASLRSALSRLEASGTGSGLIAGGGAPAALVAHRGEGRIEDIGKDEVMLSHGPIPSLKWPAMTMGFARPAEGLPLELKAGDRVRFEFVQGDRGYRLTRVERLPNARDKP